MLDLPANGYTWATFAVVLLTAFISFFTSRAKRKQNYFKKVDEARREYRKALEEGDVEKIMIAKKRYHAAKALLVVLALILTTSCVAHKQTFIPVGDYVRVMKTGDVVPELPSGEKYFMLLSYPTGFDLIIERE